MNLQTGKTGVYKKLSALLSILFLLWLILPGGSSAASAKTRVRVGWYLSGLFQEGMSDTEIKSGYCYDYLQKVSDYTSWEFEYVYGNWPDLYNMLEKGEIDVLGGVSLTEERRDKMLFPNSPMGTDQYHVYRHISNPDLSFEDPASLAGKKIGGFINNMMTVYTEKWILDNQLDLEIVYFDSFEEQEAAFENGSLDLMVQTINNAVHIGNAVIMNKVGEDPFYLAISKTRPDLLQSLNKALDTMLSIDPFILQNLQYKNYGATLTSKIISNEELQWVTEHPSLRVGYLDNYLPYSDQDSNGQPTGLMIDVTAAIVASLNLESSLSTEYIPYTCFDDMITALREKQIDLAFPVYGNLWDLEQKGIDASSAIISSSEAFFYKGTYDREQIKTIAVNKNNSMQIAYCRRNFAETDLIYFDSIEECLSAVLNGKADGTIINSLRTELVTVSPFYKSLSYVQLQTEDSRCYGVNENDTALLLLLNRGIRMIGSAYGIDHSYRYMGSFYSYGALDFILDNLLWIALLLALIVSLIICLLTVSLKRKEKIVKEKEKYINRISSLNRELEESKAKADAANAAKTSFLFNMSHDIRTPMNAIMGFRDLLEKHQDDPGKRENYLGKIKESSDVLLSIINNVLEMARIEKGTVELDETAWSVTQFNDSIYSVFHEMMEQKGITFTRTMDIRHPYVYCDPTKLREVFFNIISNAYKYTEHGGSVSMHVEELPSDQNTALFKTTISDTGVGMSQDFLPHLFEEFSRERTTTQTQIEGTGLGMSIVKRLVEMMNGTIEVQSVKNKGTTFTVTIPHRIADRTTLIDHSGVELDPMLFKDKCILIVEDNDMNAEIVTEILREAGFRTERAEDGQIAVDRMKNARDNEYHLILMDIQMPNMNGYDATMNIRALADQNKACIPILAMTANAFEEDRQQAFRCGMNGHLAKPVNVREMMKEISRLIR